MFCGPWCCCISFWSPGSSNGLEPVNVIKQTGRVSFVLPPCICTTDAEAELASLARRIYAVGTVKQEWNTVKTFPDLSGTSKILNAKFGKDASYLAVTSMDRNLRVFGLAPELATVGE